MKIFSLKRKTIPMAAVLVTGMAASIMVATVNPLAAQATPRASNCAGCHADAGGAVATVTAVPSSATLAPSAAYTVAITLSANPAGGFTGYGIVPVAPATEKTFGGNTGALLAYTATMTAPAAAGTYSYTVYTNQGSTSAGLVGSKVYSITVGAVVTTPPVTTPPVTTPPVTTPPVTTPPVTTPPVIIAPIRVGEDSLSPSSALGVSHLSMYNLKGATCTNCHDGDFVPAPPRITGDSINMKPGIACGTCHNARGEEDPLFISLMNNPTKVVYSRCSDCHVVVSGQGGDDGEDGDDGEGGENTWGTWGGWDD